MSLQRRPIATRRFYITSHAGTRPQNRITATPLSNSTPTQRIVKSSSARHTINNRQNPPTLIIKSTRTPCRRRPNRSTIVTIWYRVTPPSACLQNSLTATPLSNSAPTHHIIKSSNTRHTTRHRRQCPALIPESTCTPHTGRSRGTIPTKIWYSFTRNTSTRPQNSVAATSLSHRKNTPSKPSTHLYTI